MSVWILSPSSNSTKKWTVTNTVTGKTVHFGAAGYEDYTMHHSFQRYENYISRHRSRENWTKSGVNTAGFWSRWLLWNKPSLTSSIKDIYSRFKIRVVRAK